MKNYKKIKKAIGVMNRTYTKTRIKIEKEESKVSSSKNAKKKNSLHAKWKLVSSKQKDDKKYKQYENN